MNYLSKRAARRLMIIGAIEFILWSVILCTAIAIGVGAAVLIDLMV